MAITNLIISGRNWIKESGAANPTGGSWRLPITNILDPRPKVVAESVDTNTSSTQFSVDLGANKPIDLIWFANLRTSRSASVNLVLSTHADFSSPVYSGTVSAWPQDTTAGGADNWGITTSDGVYDPKTYDAIGRPRFFPITNVSARYVLVGIDDHGSATPVQIGCFGVSEVINQSFAFNWQLTFLDESIKTIVPNGSTYFDLRSRKRRLSIGLPPTDESYIYTRIFDWLSWMGQSTPFVIIPFGEQTYVKRYEKTGIYGCLSSAPAFTNPFTSYYNLGLQVDQL